MRHTVRNILPFIVWLFGVMVYVQANGSDIAQTDPRQHEGLLQGMPKNAVAQAGAGEHDIASSLQDSFIWLKSAPVGQQVYAAFRKQFELAEVPRTGVLHLFADSRYILWINGQYVERGPGRFDPIAPEYDILDVTSRLRPGINIIAVLVHHYHDGRGSNDWSSFSGRIMRHAPGLTARLDMTFKGDHVSTIQTDETWRGSTRTRFLPSPTDRWENTWSSIPDRIDARRETGDWTSVGINDSAWERAVFISGRQWGLLRARSIPRLREIAVEPLYLAEATPRPLAETLPIALTAGRQLVIDVGRFVQAYTVLEFEAEEGSQIETEHAQRFYQTNHKPAESYGRVNCYTACAGAQNYMSCDTFGFKYLVIRVKSGSVRLLNVRVVSRVYPFEVVGRFKCNDDLLNRLWQYSVNTVQACSEDACVDCATRERTEWMADGYVQAYHVTQVALAGPGSNGGQRMGDPRLLRRLLRHIGQSAQTDGRVKAHHPSDRWDIHGYIEDYACLWIQAIREYTDHTGDLDLARELWPAVQGQLNWFLQHRTERGLIQARDFVYPGSNPLCYKICEGTTLNAHVVKAFQDASHLAGCMGLSEQDRAYATSAHELRDALNRCLWDDHAGTYLGGLLDGQPYPPTVPAAFMTLYFDMAPTARRDRVQKWLLAHYQEHTGLPYSYQFLLEALRGIDTPETDALLLNIIRQKWTDMANSETHTVWEGFAPGENCHESGSIPAYILSACVLGVKLDGPVTRRRLWIEPHLGDLKEAEGTVATELGPARVNWRCLGPDKALEYEIELPNECQATLALPFHGGHPAVFLDGRRLSESQILFQGRYAMITAGPGSHQGRLIMDSPEK